MVSMATAAAVGATRQAVVTAAQDPDGEHNEEDAGDVQGSDSRCGRIEPDARSSPGADSSVRTRSGPSQQSGSKMEPWTCLRPPVEWRLLVTEPQAGS